MNYHIFNFISWCVLKMSLFCSFSKILGFWWLLAGVLYLSPPEAYINPHCWLLLVSSVYAENVILYNIGGVVLFCFSCFCFLNCWCFFWIANLCACPQYRNVELYIYYFINSAVSFVKITKKKKIRLQKIPNFAIRETPGQKFCRKINRSKICQFLTSFCHKVIIIMCIELLLSLWAWISLFWWVAVIPVSMVDDFCVVFVWSVKLIQWYSPYCFLQVVRTLPINIHKMPVFTYVLYILQFLFCWFFASFKNLRKLHKHLRIIWKNSSHSCLASLAHWFLKTLMLQRQLKTIT